MEMYLDDGKKHENWVMDSTDRIDWPYLDCPQCLYNYEEFYHLEEMEDGSCKCPNCGTVFKNDEELLWAYAVMFEYLRKFINGFKDENESLERKNKTLMKLLENVADDLYETLEKLPPEVR